jgi:hypothetical protein
MSEIAQSWTDFKSALDMQWLSGERDEWKLWHSHAHDFLRGFKKSEDADLANEAWLIKAFCDLHLYLLDAWQKNVETEFSEAWCIFERAEILLYSVQRNLFIADLATLADAILHRIRNWQELYPYGVFASPEFLIKKLECSVCGNVRSPWKFCGHEKGKVYSGELCYDIVKSMEVLGLGIVTNPVQKYSILQLDREQEGEEAYMRRHAQIGYAMRMMPDAFACFDVVKMKKRWPHDAFPNLKSHEACHCKSGNSYGQCCENEDGVLMPHMDIRLHGRPKAGFQPMIIIPSLQD